MNAVGSRGPPVFITSGSAVYISLRIVWPRRASAVERSGDDAVTRTSCLMPDTCSVTFKPTTLNASTMMPVRTNGSKPSRATVILYSPGGSGVSAYTPAPVVWRAVSMPVARCVAVTVAPGKAALDESSTVP